MPSPSNLKSMLFLSLLTTLIQLNDIVVYFELHMKIYVTYEKPIAKQMNP